MDPAYLKAMGLSAGCVNTCTLLKSSQYERKRAEGQGTQPVLMLKYLHVPTFVGTWRYIPFDHIDRGTMSGILQRCGPTSSFYPTAPILRSLSCQRCYTRA